MVNSACSRTVNCTAKENEETPHQAEVQGWSNFIAEEITVKTGYCLAFTHIYEGYSEATHYLSFDRSALLCKKAATTLFMYKQ